MASQRWLTCKKKCCRDQILSTCRGTTASSVVATKNGIAWPEGTATTSRRGIQGMFAYFQPEEDGGDADESAVAVGPLFVAGGDGPVLLEPVDRPLDPFALEVGDPREAL